MPFPGLLNIGCHTRHLSQCRHQPDAAPGCCALLSAKAAKQASRRACAAEYVELGTWRRAARGEVEEVVVSTLTSPLLMVTLSAPLCFQGPALFWHGSAPTQQQFNLLKPNWPRIIIQRLVRPWLAYLPAAVALPVGDLGEQKDLDGKDKKGECTGAGERLHWEQGQITFEFNRTRHGQGHRATIAGHRSRAFKSLFTEK
jgi:hypothetical protein